MTAKNCATNTMQDCLAEAEQRCMQRGARLTDLRRSIFEILLAARKPVKAYDIIECMRDRGQRLTPASIYRTLEFLLGHGLAHRVNALNAYVPCTGPHEEQALLLFVCSGCRGTTEIDDRVLYDAVRSRLAGLGISLRNGCIEIQGICRNCLQA
ncbi:MAG: transcriptional repressor [Desulfovibrio sp.]|jgi:Fur family zinc uptake transcriptional regulator|nr:transcriptional repressor [Desulfovibrio sp.]